MSGGHIYVDRTSLGDGADRTVLAPSGNGGLELVTNQIYPPQAADPAVPPPSPGDRYFNTAAREWRWYDGVLWRPYGGSVVGAAAPFWLGAWSVAASTTTRYLFPAYEDGLAQTAPVPIVMPRPGTLMNLYVRHATPNGNGNLIGYTVRVNSVPTLLAVSLASTGVIASNLVDSVPVVAGDRVDIKITKAANVAAGPNYVIAAMELA